MSKVIRFLAVNSFGDVRVTKRPPILCRDEVGYRLVINIPEPPAKWPLKELEVTVPEVLLAQAEIGEQLEPETAEAEP